MNGFFNFNGAEVEAIQLSLEVAIYCTLISLPIALAVGYGMARSQFFGKSLIESLLHLPLVLPPVTTGYLLLVFLGAKSPFGLYLYDLFGVQLSFRFPAAVIAAIVVSFPLVVRSIRTSMEMVDPKLEEASRVLGAGKLKTFFKITVPLAFPGILSGAVLAFARSLGEFGATITFAGNIEGETQTLPLAIYNYMQVPGSEEPTMRLVLVSLVIAFVAMALSEWSIKKIKHDNN